MTLSFTTYPRSETTFIEVNKPLSHGESEQLEKALKEGTKITDLTFKDQAKLSEFLSKISRIQELSVKNLIFCGDSISDDDLPTLEKFSKINSLDLSKVYNITEEGLVKFLKESVKNMPSLTRVSVAPTFSSLTCNYRVLDIVYPVGYVPSDHEEMNATRYGHFYNPYVDNS